MNFMKRGFSAELYYNGFVWNHQTDSNGFRNPEPAEQKDVLLLGDSMIYGHGVEETETLSHYLRAEHGIGAYNMGMQGSCLYQYCVLFRMFFARFEPRKVVLFTFINDVDDLRGYLGRFDWIDRTSPIPEIESFDYDEIYRSVFSRNSDDHSLGRRLRYSLRTYGLARGISSEARKLMGFKKARDILAPVQDDGTLERALRYYVRILTDLRTRCAAGGAELVVVNVFWPLGGEDFLAAQRKFASGIQELCDEHEITFHDTVDEFVGVDDCFLSGDGHFSPEGHRRLAAYLAERLR